MSEAARTAVIEAHCRGLKLPEDLLPSLAPALVEDEAEAAGDLAAQAVRPELQRVVTRRRRRGRQSLLAISGVTGARPSGNSSTKDRFTNSGAPRM